MTPTNKLRFVERLHPHMAHQTVRVLQQWWEDSEWSHVSKFIDGEFQPKGKWRDVPLEKENATS